MEKLIELLNEYNCKVLKHTDKWKEKSGKLILKIDDNHSRGFNSDLYVISKKYGFIKWLVENEKIERDEIIINSDFMPVAFDRKGEKYNWSEEKQLLMLLSIQDEPIEFLVSILK